MLPEKLSDLVTTVQKHDLYVALIQQLNKDLIKANIASSFPFSLPPEILYNDLSGLLKTLMESDFRRYLNLLYIIDVPENQIKAQEETEVQELSCKVAILILQREWQKVWFRKQFS
ncbi:hypothetical protein [Winogradskyella aurantiaca]|uniref:hypothetical protein n=1 Tax=Winogradskyella aurantiaca TaxID=2219558 RepID=UPI000E1E1148|nr:hypothetical protein [Winogradskyella aurantiaca]